AIQQWIAVFIGRDGRAAPSAPRSEAAQRKARRVRWVLQFRRLTLRSAAGTSQRDVPTAGIENAVASSPSLSFRQGVQLKTWRYDLQLAHKWAIAGGRGQQVCPVVLVQLKDADGVTGLGEAAPVQRYQESVETVQAFCSRVDARKLSFADVPGS